jgi:hypothetical protein
MKSSTPSTKSSTRERENRPQTIKLGFGGAFSLALAYFKALLFVNYAESAAKK